MCLVGGGGSPSTCEMSMLCLFSHDTMLYVTSILRVIGHGFVEISIQIFLKC